jgi:hypothetical protein
MGLTLNDVQKQELERRIANSKKQKEYKDESATKKRRKNLRVGRLQQNKNYNKDYKNPKDVRKHKSNNNNNILIMHHLEIYVSVVK